MEQTIGDGLETAAAAAAAAAAATHERQIGNPSGVLLGRILAGRRSLSSGAWLCNKQDSTAERANATQPLRRHGIAVEAGGGRPAATHSIVD
jgi:hypothetical protein